MLSNNLYLYILYAVILVSLIIFVLLLRKISKLEKEKSGYVHILDKSEEGRIDSEKQKNRIR